MKYILLISICLTSFLISFSQNEKNGFKVIESGKRNKKEKESQIQKAAKKEANKTDTLFITIQDNVYTKRFRDGAFVRFLDSKYPMQITIKNINPFLYNITMKEYQNDYLNEMKNENIQALNYTVGNLAVNFPEPNYKNFNFIEPKSAVTKNNIENINENVYKIQNQINEIYKKTIYRMQDSLQKGTTVNKDLLQDSINKADYKVASLIRQKNDFKDQLSKITEEHNDGKNKTLLFIGLQVSFINHLKEYNEYVLKLQQLFHFYQALKIQVYTPGKSIGELESDKKAILARYLKDIISTDTTLRSIESFELTYQYHAILTKIKKIVGELGDDYSSFMFKKGDTDQEKELALNMKALIDWLNEEQKKISVSAMDNIISNTTLLYNSINEEMFTQYYMVDNVKDKTDYVQFVFEAAPKLQNQSAIVPKPISYKIIMPIKQGVQMNVSSGFFFNIGLSNEEWFYKPTANIDSFELSKSPYKVGDLFKPSIGLLLQVYKRSPYAHRLAGCFGFSTNATDINYYLGTSWIFGKAQRCVISAGFVGGQREVLKSSFGEGRDDRLVSGSFKENNPVIETAKKFKIGTFLSITFNLWGKSTKEFNFEGNGVKDAKN
ncbi:MAG TPA: hypothetical protein VK498_02290 [Ferruginibacter sp.]|nr:hypothetical protein [Ferruginibacter sp.]